MKCYDKYLVKLEFDNAEKSKVFDCRGDAVKFVCKVQDIFDVKVHGLTYGDIKTAANGGTYATVEKEEICLKDFLACSQQTESRPCTDAENKALRDLIKSMNDMLDNCCRRRGFDRWPYPIPVPSWPSYPRTSPSPWDYGTWCVVKETKPLYTSNTETSNGITAVGTSDTLVSSQDGSCTISSSI